jgi:hypothetical protein
MHRTRDLALAFVLAIVLPGIAHAGYGAVQFNLAENLAVLQAWQQATNATQAPQLVSKEGGGTVLEWHGGVAADKYETDASGGRLLTPQESGSYHRVDAEGKLCATSPTGDVTYALLSLTNTDDPSVLTHSTQINTLQVGRMTQAYEIALGDVNPGFSSLGTDLAMRGLLAKVHAGQTTIAGGAGVVAENWRSLWKSESRTQYQRDACALKLDTPITRSANLFVTAQGYSDREESLSAGTSVLEPASAYATTAGFTFQKNGITLEGEMGASRWEEEGQDSQSDNAVILDAGWRGEKVGLRAGHHDLGPYYASVSAMASPGIEETYLGGDWTPSDWLTLNADLRRSENKQLGLTSIAQTADSIATDANLNLDRLLQGLSLSLQHYYSAGEYEDGNESTNQNYGASFSYLGECWIGGIAYSYNDVSDDSFPETNSATRTWTGNIGLNVSKYSSAGAATWSANVTLTSVWQEQDLDSGSTTENYNYNLGFSVKRDGWGAVNAGYLWGTMTQTTGGPDLEQDSMYADATYQFKGQNALKFYLRRDEFSGDPVSSYHERTIGVQLVLML